MHFCVIDGLIGEHVGEYTSINNKQKKIKVVTGQADPVRPGQAAATRRRVRAEHFWKQIRQGK
jgi:hypothetical protein